MDGAILLLVALLPVALCQAPVPVPGQTYLASLVGELVPTTARMPYAIRLLFQDDAQTIADVCETGNNVNVSELCTEVYGYQWNDGEPAMSRSPCTGLDRNLGTSVYRVAPKVCIKERRLMTLAFYGPRVFLVLPEPTDRFCLFMLDAGVLGNPRMLENQPFIHWAVCNIQGGNLTTGTELVTYLQVPGVGTQSKRIVWVLYKQPDGDLINPLDNFVVPVQACTATPGRCQFDILQFAITNNLEIGSVLVTRAAPDIVGLNMMRPFIGGATMCQLYRDIDENYAAVDDGHPARQFWCKHVARYYNGLP